VNTAVSSANSHARYQGASNHQHCHYERSLTQITLRFREINGATGLELATSYDKNDVRDDLLPVVLWTDDRRLLFRVYGSEGVAAVQRIR